MVVSIIQFYQDSENVSLAKIIPSGDIQNCVWMYVPSKCRIFYNRRPLTNMLLQIVNLQIYNGHRTYIYTPSESLWTYQPVGIHVWVIISPKFEISGILWFWFGRRRSRRRTPRLVSHVTATPMRVSNSYLTQTLMT